MIFIVSNYPSTYPSILFYSGHSSESPANISPNRCSPFHSIGDNSPGPGSFGMPGMHSPLCCSLPPLKKHSKGPFLGIHVREQFSLSRIAKGPPLLSIRSNFLAPKVLALHPRVCTGQLSQGRTKKQLFLVFFPLFRVFYSYIFTTWVSSLWYASDYSMYGENVALGPQVVFHGRFFSPQLTTSSLFFCWKKRWTAGSSIPSERSLTFQLGQGAPKYQLTPQNTYFWNWKGLVSYLFEILYGLSRGFWDHKTGLWTH